MNDGPRTDAPRTNKDPQELERKRSLLHQPHVAPLTEHVQELRSAHGDDHVPDFDPTEAGVDASILLLFEAPGPNATSQRGGSGFVSCDNDDATAENMWRVLDGLGVDRRREIVSWNVVPWYVGSDTNIRPVNTADLAASRPSIAALCRLLPKLAVVVLLGRKAQQGWPALGIDLPVVHAPHPSPKNLNTRPQLRPELRAAIQRAREIAAAPRHPAVPHTSDSAEQRGAEDDIRALVTQRLGVPLESGRIALGGGTSCRVDGVSADERIFVEIFARQGALKSGQVRKVARDALKLITIARTRPEARLILAFACPEAAACVENPKTWLSEARRAANIEVMTVALSDPLVAGLRTAQTRQFMGPAQAPDGADAGPLPIDAR